MPLRDDLVDALLNRLRPAVQHAVNDALGTTPRAPERAAERVVPRRPRSRRPTTSPRTDESYCAADRRARRLPTYVRALLGGEPTKKEILDRFGPSLVFTPKTTSAEVEAAANRWAATKASERADAPNRTDPTTPAGVTS